MKRNKWQNLIITENTKVLVKLTKRKHEKEEMFLVFLMKKE